VICSYSLQERSDALVRPISAGDSVDEDVVVVDLFNFNNNNTYLFYVT